MRHKGILFLCLMLTMFIMACECKQVVKQEPPPPPPPPAPAPAPEEKIVLNGIRFDFDKAIIKPEFVPVLDEAADILKKHPNKKVTIEGHCDGIGSEAYNMKLGMRRATSVKNYLVEKGISAEMLDTVSYGKDRPIADNKTKEGRAMNRRAEFKVAE